MEGSIFLNDLEFFGTHGVYSSEREHEQKFLVSVELLGNFLPAAQKDDIQCTADYSKIYNEIKKILEEQHVNLIESLAYRIAKQLLEKFDQISSIKIIIKKFPSSWEGRTYGNIGFQATITR